MTERDIPKTKFHALLQEQIYNEFTAAQQYVAIAVYFDDAHLPQLANHFYRQAVEERNHAMMLVQHLLDRDLGVEIPGVGPSATGSTPRQRRWRWRLTRSVPSPSRSAGWPPRPATKATTSASSSCSGSSANRSRRWR
ncbi:putative bacterioferritin BfrB [Mycobacterium xenopi 3993]|nr:putative bacterioferritin BfrB [Mycobacterium xenopi 3993]